MWETNTSLLPSSVMTLSRMSTLVGWEEEKVAMLPRSPTCLSRDVGSPWSF